MVIYIDVNDKGILQGWGSSPLSEGAIAVEVEENHPLFSAPPRLFRYTDGQIVKDNDIVLDRAKKKKDRELNKACGNAITSGFDFDVNGVTYHFSYDTEAQLNYQESLQMLKDGDITEDTIYPRLNGEKVALTVDKVTMKSIVKAGQAHKKAHLSKYRGTLQSQIKEAKTLEEVQAINW